LKPVAEVVCGAAPAVVAALVVLLAFDVVSLNGLGDEVGKITR
jgi:hypothetical protein